MSVQREMHVRSGAWWILCSKLQKLSRKTHKASVDGTQVAWDKLEDFEDDLQRAYEWLTGHKRKRRTSCSSRKEVRKLQKACERLRDAYAAAFEDELSDDDDGWVYLEMNIHHVWIPKVEEKEVQKEVGQESLKQPLDTPTLPLECAHRVETEYPLLKLMSVLSLVNEMYYSKEKQIIQIEDVVHKNQRPFEEADNVRNGQVDSQMNGRITNKESKQEEVSKIKCTEEEFVATTRNKSVPEELSPRRSTDVNMQLAKLVEIAKDIVANDDVIFGNADGAEFYYGYCQAICQFGSQADDVNVAVEDVQQNADLMSNNQRSVVQVSEYGKVKKLIQEDFQELASGQNPLHNSFINLDQKEFSAIKFIQEESKEKFFAINERAILGLQGEVDEYVELNAVKSKAVEKEQNVAGGVEVAIGIQDLWKDLKSESRIAELQMEFGLRIRNVWQMENERLVAKMEELKNKSKGIKVSSWGLSKWKSELSSGVSKPDQNLASGVKLDVEKQMDLDFVAEKAVETDA
ncbi:hypothetical protein L7F22_024062 [Adiantum nelumboides]|nr:hypothetical protein [Adiantum nelumboides]